MKTLQVSCIELCRADELCGYAIFFSGGWDAYIVDGRNSLLCIGRNFLSWDAAAKAVNLGHDWRKIPLATDMEKR